MYLQFENYLQKTGITKKSIKNYKSDISHFMGWAILKLKTIGTYIENLSDLSPFLTSKFITEYLSYMIGNNFPRQTVNRRLSTLRHLSKFLIASQIIDFDFMGSIQNLPSEELKLSSSLSNHKSVHDFRSFLEAQSVSKNTIKNYMSDVKQFLTWLENKTYGQPS